MTNVRFCRICWNSQRWRHPSGDPDRYEIASFVADHGFGHEEWLLNFGWMIKGYHYGFLQPLNLKYPPLRPDIQEVILHTRAPSGIKLFVGRIKQCEILTLELAAEAYEIYQRNGWIDEMAEDLRRIKADPALITKVSSPLSVANVCFKPEDIEILDPFIPVPYNHPVYNFHRYLAQYASPSAWAEILKIRGRQITSFYFLSGRLKSTERRERAAQRGVSFDPAHDRLQEALWMHLKKEYGSQNVGYEVDGVVDLAIKREDSFVFYEIKMEATVKHCIRLALGQLLEYAHWPAQNKAHKLIVIGKFLPDEDDKYYLLFLRKQYGLPLYYQRYDVAADTLSQEY